MVSRPFLSGEGARSTVRASCRSCLRNPLASCRCPLRTPAPQLRSDVYVNTPYPEQPNETPELKPAEVRRFQESRSYLASRGSRTSAKPLEYKSNRKHIAQHVLAREAVSPLCGHPQQGDRSGAGYRRGVEECSQDSARHVSHS